MIVSIKGFSIKRKKKKKTVIDYLVDKMTNLEQNKKKYGHLFLEHEPTCKLLKHSWLNQHPKVLTLFFFTSVKESPSWIYSQ